MIKLLHIDDFYGPGEAEKLANVVRNLNFQETEFGKEIPDFQLVDPELPQILSRILKDDITVDEERSGSFRHPAGFIHFEPFDDPNEWILVVALDHTIFNVFENKKEGVLSALDKYQLNYRNFFDWDVVTNVQLKPNHCVIFRPWLFHSFNGGLIQTYRLKVAKPERSEEDGS